MRVRVLSMAGALSACEAGETSFPGTVVDGNYTIRPQ